LTIHTNSNLSFATIQKQTYRRKQLSDQDWIRTQNFHSPLISVGHRISYQNVLIYTSHIKKVIAKIFSLILEER